MRNGRRKLLILFCEEFFSYLQVILSCPKILHGAYGFTSPKEDVLRICIALKNPLRSAGTEPANLVSKGKHASHYTI
jgi:hypothetical protein